MAFKYNVSNVYFKSDLAKLLLCVLFQSISHLLPSKNQVIVYTTHILLELNKNNEKLNDSNYSVVIFTNVSSKSIAKFRAMGDKSHLEFVCNHIIS